MKKTILVLTVLLIQTFICFGQGSNLNSVNSENNATKSCMKQLENKAIGLSGITSDTLTFQQFTQCHKITVNSLFGEEITSFKLNYSLPGGADLIERTESSNKLSDELIESVISSGTKKLVFSEVIGVKGSENILIGFRCFYLN